MTSPPKRRRALSPTTIGKSSWEMVDFDYLHKLTEEQLDFLEQFSQEYYRATFRNNESDFYQQKTPQRRERYADNNARNRDVWNEYHRAYGDCADIADPDDGEDG